MFKCEKCRVAQEAPLRSFAANPMSSLPLKSILGTPRAPPSKGTILQMKHWRVSTGLSEHFQEFSFTDDLSLVFRKLSLQMQCLQDGQSSTHSNHRLGTLMEKWGS